MFWVTIGSNTNLHLTLISLFSVVHIQTNVVVVSHKLAIKLFFGIAMELGTNMGGLQALHHYKIYVSILPLHYLKYDYIIPHGPHSNLKLSIYTS